ncbi:CmcI family methyltransferase [Calothrix sp. NIES-3974]|uniref:CmcI family methyltransferase n=1 Tax=Calothrix sp. NIES-3974 TaxID=2005462 RepID=UPI000B603DB9|nr:CmcI family methyltransferase [Calothrix sp. NIES-3974]BAZ07214.1 hypothetical protein NIES3974_38770 [Calothrix sp. NIES-3974]
MFTEKKPSLNHQIPINDAAAVVRNTAEEFVKAYFYTPVIDGKPAWVNTYWQGIPALKCPLDLWIYQEIIFQQKPDFIVECGVSRGGSTAFLADMCKLVGKGQVIGIDIQILAETRTSLNRYDNIQLIEGDSVSREIAEQVYAIAGDRNTIVILDSDHSKEHVIQELETYHRLIPRGGYLIVEDTIVNNHPIYPEFGLGPMEAVEEFLVTHPDFYIDKQCHKFLATFNSNGYLKRL